MEPSAVARLVTESATRFGDRNPQQLQQLSSRLRKADPAEVLHGLISVFTHGQPAPQGSAAQELAGQLLVELKLGPPAGLEQILRSALPRCELSVEQFPRYLAATCGSSAVLQALENISRETPAEPVQRAFETMKFWLRSASSGEAQNGA
jgi:hypothetical protein